MNPHRWGPLAPDHPLVADAMRCTACHQVFEAGCYMTLVPLGPGDDEQERARAREGKPYTAATATVHWACATGELELEVPSFVSLCEHERCCVCNKVHGIGWCCEHDEGREDEAARAGGRGDYCPPLPPSTDGGNDA